MKKFILPILLFLMFIPFVANAETCDTDKITISSITVENKSDNVEELDETTASGKKINLNLSMSEVGDNIEYKFVVKNESNEDYELNKTDLNLNTDFINFSFVTDDNSNIIKANSSKTVFLKVEYKNEVPDEKFESGAYNDNQSLTLNLSTGNSINVSDTLKNPNTGVQSYILIIFVILLISITAYILLKKKNYSKFMTLIVMSAIIIPISVYALCKCEISIVCKVEIKSNKYTGSIYRNNNISISSGSINTTIKETYCKKEIQNGNIIYDSCLNDLTGYDTEEECNNDAWEGDYTHYCYYGQIEEPGAGEYVFNPNLLNSDVYIKHDVIKNIITKSYLCAKVNNSESCLSGDEFPQFWGNMSLFFEKAQDILGGNAQYVEGIPYGNYYKGYSNGSITITRSDISGAIFFIDSKIKCHGDVWVCEYNKH